MRFAFERGQTRGLRRGPARIGRQQHVAHIRAREINLPANLVQRAEAVEKRLARLGFVEPYAVQRDECANRRAGDANQQAAEPERQHHPRRFRCAHIASFTDQCNENGARG
jgi:hypothetical protein